MPSPRPLSFRSAWHLPTVWLLGALLVALVAACSDAGAPSSGAAPGRGVYIGAAWHTARTVTGHEVHVREERIACTTCHELTSDAIGAVRPDRCAACHENEARIEHARSKAAERFGAEAKADCTSCHAFTQSGTDHQVSSGFVYDAEDCYRCHAQKQGAVPAVTIHSESACVSCHRPHEDERPVSAPCVDCHKDVKSTHGSERLGTTAACAACHVNQHAPASDARPTCAACHAKQKPLVPSTALFAQGHVECIGCHRPHAFEKSAAVACRSCHEDVAVLGAPRVRQHDQCTSCHAPHDVRGSAERACEACHQDKHPNHPKPVAVDPTKAGRADKNTGTCIGCHQPHPQARESTRARRCSGCHQVAASDKSFHGGTGCTQCHQPHDFVRALAERAGCEACHAKEVTLTSPRSGHQACEGCHAGLPHRPTKLAVGCASCHASEQQDVGRGHAMCGSCHEPHGGGVSRACASCHQEERKGAPHGHENCTACHQPHSGSTAKAPCASCHAGEAQTKHGGIAQGCKACHQPHGPGRVATPACTSCHAQGTLPGLHTIPKHEACGRCHTGHGEALGSGRDECLGCHADRKNHYPDAPRCASCHLFNRSR